MFEQMQDKQYAVKGGAVFTARHAVNLEAKGYQDMNWVYTLREVRVTVWGDYELNGRKDGAARVEVRHLFSDGSTDAWTHATAWNGSTLAAFAEGGRRAVAAAVVADVVAIVEAGGAGGAWERLAVQAWEADRARRASSERSQAARYLEQAARIDAEVCPSIFEAVMSVPEVSR